MTTLGRWVAYAPSAARRALGTAAVLAEGTRFDLALVAQILAGEPEAIVALSWSSTPGSTCTGSGTKTAFTHRGGRRRRTQRSSRDGVGPWHQWVLEHLRTGTAASISDPIEIATCASAIAHHASRADFGGLATTIGLGAWCASLTR